jgi:hypothetical protein
MGKLQPYDLEYTISTDYGALVLGNDAIAGNEVTAPKQWKEGLVKWIRNEKYFGLFRSLSIPMQFVTKGKELLDYVYAMQGSEGNATITISRLKRESSTDAWTHIKWFEGKVDFAQCKSTRTSFECNIIEGGLSQIIKSKANTKYDINKAGYNLGLDYHFLISRHPLPNTIPTDEYDYVTLRSAIQCLLNQMAGYTVPFYCPILDALDADNAPLMLTNGRALRNRYANMKNLTTSLDEIFQFFNAMFCAGMGVDVIGGVDTVVIAEKSYFLADTKICETLPNTRAIEISHAKQFSASKIKYGSKSFEGLTYPFGAYSPSQIEDFNKARFHKINNGSIPVTTSTAEIDASCDYTLDGNQTIVTLEYNQGDTTTEEQWDNDIYIAHAQYIHSISNYEWAFYAGHTTEQLNSKNTWLSPKRALYRWLPYLNSITSGIVNVLAYPVEIEIVLPEGVANSSTVVHSDYSNDDSIEPVSVILDGTNQIFKPYIFKIKTAGTVDIADIFEANHNGYISFMYKGVEIKGHIMEVSANPTRRKELEMTLLAHKDTDLTDIFPMPQITP